MTALAGHWKDPRLVQTDLLEPIIKGDENYTPEYFLSPCKEFLGVIDLDPFSCAIANHSIGADVFWTREDDALNQDWSGFERKWVNPPYSSKLIGKAIAKTLEYAHIGETLLLVNTSSSAKWFQACMAQCAAYLHPSRRINFDSPYRTSKANRYDQTLFYFGDRPLEFAEALSSLGNAVQPIRKSCSPTLISSAELGHSALPPETQEKLPPSPMLTSAPTRKRSTKATSQKSPSTEISETISHVEELTSIRADSLVQTQVLRETREGLTETNLNYGLSTCDASKKDSPDLSLSKTPQGCLIAEWEQSLKAYPKAGTMRNGKLYPLEPLAVPKLGKESLSLPTMTTGLGSGRNAGATRLERYLKDKGFVQDTQALSVEMMALLFGFPMDWALDLLESPKESREGMKPEPCLEEQSMSTAPLSLSSESSTLIDALVKVRINKTSLEIPADIAPIFNMDHTVGINIVNPSILDLIKSLSSDRLRFALELSEKYGGCQKKRELLIRHLKGRDSLEKYKFYSREFPSGTEVEIIAHPKSTNVWAGNTGIVQPYKCVSEAATISYRIAVKIYSEKVKDFVTPYFEDFELKKINISANTIDAKSNLLLDRTNLVAGENSLELLLDQAKQLRDSGAAPDGIWLSSSKVRDRDFYQVQWRSREQHPWLGNQKSRYVGISDSDEHKSAIAQHRAGQELRKIEKQIKKLIRRKNTSKTFLLKLCQYILKY